MNSTEKSVLLFLRVSFEVAILNLYN